MKIQSTVLALAAAAALAAPVVPAAAKETRTQVTYNDLDLSTEAGRTALAGRLDQAAKNLCGVREDNSGSRYARDCYKRNTQYIDQQVAAIVRQQAAGG